MPIRFYCQRCRQLLGIATRKAGSEIQCPKCGWSQVVPSQEAALAAIAMDLFARNHEALENTSNLTVYDDEPALIEMPQPADLQRPPLESPTAATAPAASTPRAQDLRGEPLPPGMILFPRRTLYIQGLLLLILFAVGFGSGYFIGRGGAEDQRRKDQPAQERILVEGTLVYDPGTGRLAGDHNAVIIALPEGKLPRQRISSEGIRPQALSAESQKSVQMIRELGGEYARADTSGNFSLVVPDRGRYHLLFISNHATRPEGTDIGEADLSQMEQYFSMAALLIGRYKYSWTLREINDDLRIDRDFGRDGQEDAQ
jgi:hypothetical protein